MFRTPFPHDPAVILELRPQFAENASEALATTKRLLELTPR